LHKELEDFARELRLAAAVKWYELKMLSQERAAHVAGLSRAEFLDALGASAFRRSNTAQTRSGGSRAWVSLGLSAHGHRRPARCNRLSP